MEEHCDFSRDSGCVDLEFALKLYERSLKKNGFVWGNS